MIKTHKLLKYIFRLSIYKTVRVNFRCLPFNQAICFPILVAKNVHIVSTKGFISLNCKPRLGLILLGFNGPSFYSNGNKKGSFELNGSFEISGNVRIGIGSDLSIKGRLIAGKNFQINAAAKIIVYNNISFGDDVLLSWGVTIIDTDFHKIYSDNEIYINPDKPIKIGNNVWIGMDSKILKGSSIPDGCIIASSSTVSSTLHKKNTIYVNNKILKTDIYWKR